MVKVKLEIAEAVAGASAWSLQHVFHRPAANFPGKAALLADPDLIADLRPRLREGAIAIVGTNGKTTVANLVADTLEASGKEVICNRTGANLDSGIASALLQRESADWGVFECDELWLSRIASQLAPDYVVLLNLFRDQLDRMGEIALIQESIAGALESSPSTTLLYNCDDPLCQAIAGRVGNRAIPFGIADCLGLSQNTVSDAGLCQRCDSLLEYSWRQYGQLGSYACPQCGFSRAQPAYTACDVCMDESSTSLSLRGGAVDLRFDQPFTGAYMIYNVLAAYAATDRCGAPFAAFEHAVRMFDPQNGRLQRYARGDGAVLLNLAKNPTGLNQNLKIVREGTGPKAVAFFINDREADGHDVSWLWDVDFQELAWCDDLAVYAGGTRKHDLQVRLKHAGIRATLVEGAGDFLDDAFTRDPHATCYAIANYTALPAVKTQIERYCRAESKPHGRRPSAPADAMRADLGQVTPRTQTPTSSESLTIVHLYPTLLNLYGDGGNVTVLANRARWRGMAVEVRRIDLGQKLDLSQADIVFLGGGPDREQHLASVELRAQADELKRYVEDDGVLLAICGGYQILGREWLMGDEDVAGLALLDLTTTRAAGDARNRLVGNIALRSDLAAQPVIGYENHAGRTRLDPGCAPFGRVMGRHGHGNDDAGKQDGVRFRNVVGSYLHGPLLAKNPEVADWLIEQALARRAAAEARRAPQLPPLDDAEEQAANRFMQRRLGISR